MDMFGYTQDQKNDIFAILSSILNLGNIQFQKDDNNICIIEASTRKFLQRVSSLLNIDELELETALTCRIRKIAYQQIK